MMIQSMPKGNSSGPDICMVRYFKQFKQILAKTLGIPFYLEAHIDHIISIPKERKDPLHCLS